ncbi:hypothetical protein MLD38_011567 [Melastoma candidum]|uniref:Uncharacterized protein n=1 Tax=Melastoma candidum TaxID=119954 RepID=A0ACB9R4T4_9MYRT|nr:hypothetical protein MLD38_011567 [Melastoma candidum]
MLPWQLCSFTFVAIRSRSILSAGLWCQKYSHFVQGDRESVRRFSRNFGSNAIVTFAFSPLKVTISSTTCHFKDFHALFMNLGLVSQYALGGGNVFLLFGAIALLSLCSRYCKSLRPKGLSLEEIESKILK